MTRKPLLLGAIVLAAVIVAPIAWYLISPLFITRTVDEDFPAAQTAMQENTDDSMSANAMPVQPTEAPSEPRLLRSGEFHSVAHEGSGTASIYELPDGKRVLRLENFEVLNGPDLYVWLSAAADAGNARTILDNQYAELGRLKGNQGNQNYELPADLDVSAFNSVTIWCRRFSVNFATAPLN
jgi:hypothetical protein